MSGAVNDVLAWEVQVAGDDVVVWSVRCSATALSSVPVAERCD